MSQPLLVVVNPLASIALSIWLFQEHFTSSPARIAVAVVSFAAMAAGVVELSRTAPQDHGSVPASRVRACLVVTGAGTIGRWRMAGRCW